MLSILNDIDTQKIKLVKIEYCIFLDNELVLPPVQFLKNPRCNTAAILNEEDASKKKN